MSNVSPDSARLEDLIHRYCDNDLDEADLRELQQILLTSDAAAKRYIECVQVWTELMTWAEIAESDKAESPADLTLSYERPKWQIKAWFGFLSIAAALAVAFFVGVYHGDDWRIGQPEFAQHQDRVKTNEPQQSLDVPSLQNGYVARVVEVTPDATWGDFKPEEFLLRLAKGDLLDLETGIARIEFSAGASVILKGPARLELLAGDAARLHSGQMTGRAEDGNFKLLTQAAEVIDLGTEFGVSVDSLANTDVCVFDGVVDVVSEASAGESSGGSFRLTEGMAMRVENSGQIHNSSDIAADTYHRHGSPSFSATTQAGLVSLADIVAGGDGHSSHVAGAIDPLTGYWDRVVVTAQEQNRNRYGQGGYTLCDASPFIDGVFIPSHEGLNTKLDSAGNTFNVGINHGMTWGPIWSRVHVSNLRSVTRGVSDFWGTDTLEGIFKVVEESQLGVVGLHSNVGMTIDLHALRQLDGKPLTRFQTKIANLDNSAERESGLGGGTPPSVDFSVFVDGRLKFVRGHFTQEEGIVPVDIFLDPEARFLTLMSTDSGDSYAFDHLVLIDPVLLFEDP